MSKITTIELKLTTEALADLDGLTARLHVEGYAETINAGLCLLRQSLDGIQAKYAPSRWRRFAKGTTSVLTYATAWAALGLAFVSMARCAI